MRTHRAKTTTAQGPLLWRWILCTLGGEGHDPLHHPLGGFRCARCGKSGRDLDELGFADEGYVSEPLRQRLAAEKGDSRAA
ncbi:MAG TPA: hypothetical protein VFO85_17365 [Vicinamibacteria bacterium]|nr:hypothetical protein [Vicinamibacteria bacterium]